MSKNHIFLNTIGEKLNCNSPNISDNPCTICGEYQMHLVKYFKSKRTLNNLWPLFFCLNCESVITESLYKEDEAQLKRDLDWNISVADRNRTYLKSLVQLLRANKIKINNILEVGCGIGTALHELKNKYNCNVFGFDVNNHAIEYGTEHYKLDKLNKTLFTKDTEVNSKIDLVICISVLEHIKYPNDLFSEIAKYCKKHKCPAFISVPFLDADRWNHFYPENINKKPNFLRACDVHISYFSTKAFVNMAIENGCTYYNRIQARAWVGYILKF